PAGSEPALCRFQRAAPSAADPGPEVGSGLVPGFRSDTGSYDFLFLHGAAVRLPGDLLPQDADMPRCLDPQPHLVALDLHHRHHALPTDHDLLVDLAAQTQHDDLLDSLARSST